MRRWQQRPSSGPEGDAPERESMGGGGAATVQTLWAPEWQPIHTWVATPADQADGMTRRSAKDNEADDAKCAEPVPTLKAGRQVGWIFKNGEAVAIERHECDSRDDEKPD
jgi:hypothetical protein